LRAERHPGIFFREGPTGRRPVVVGGPDVWEIVSALRSAPERGEAVVKALAERLGIGETKVRLGIGETKVRAAVRYYGEYPQEVNEWIAANKAAADGLEAALARELGLLA